MKRRETRPTADIPARLSDASIAARATHRSNRTQQFVRGAIPMPWLEVSAALPGKALAVGLLLWFRYGFDPGGTEPISVTPTLLARFGVGRKAGAAAVRRLAKAGLVTAEFARGRCPRVTLLGASGAGRSPPDATTSKTD